MNTDGFFETEEQLSVFVDLKAATHGDEKTIKKVKKNLINWSIVIYGLETLTNRTMARKLKHALEK